MKQFFELLKGGLWRDYTPRLEVFDNSTDWKQIFELAKIQTVAGVVWDGVEKLPQSIRPPRTITILWYGYVARLAQSNMVINQTVKELFELLESHSLHPILMKGASVAALYPDPMKRGCGDIDLFLGEVEHNAANEIIQKRYNIDLGGKRQAYHHHHYEIEGIEVENHKYLNSNEEFYGKSQFNKRLSEWYPHNPQYIDIEGYKVAVVPDKFNTQFLYHHIMRHFIDGEGVGLRQLCDLAIAMSCTKLSENDIIVKRRSWQIIERLLVRYLGLDPQFTVYNNTKFDAMADLVMRLVLEGGNFGFEREDEVLNNTPTKYVDRKIYSFKVHFDRFWLLLRPFPSESWAKFYEFLILGVTQIFNDSIGRKKRY
ncbi:MAG: nucleotidyltransferase family protein [Rikenellaceae bacterium]